VLGQHSSLRPHCPFKRVSGPFCRLPFVSIGENFLVIRAGATHSVQVIITVGKNDTFQLKLSNDLLNVSDV
jgi:hypothetical protein